MQNITLDEAVRRIQALNQFAEEAGLRLPYSPGFILGQELQGHVVDLENGGITLGAGNSRFRPTSLGKAADSGELL